MIARMIYAAAETELDVYSMVIAKLTISYQGRKL